MLGEVATAGCDGAPDVGIAIAAGYQANVRLRSNMAMARFWTNYWKNRYWRDDINKEYQPIRHSAANTLLQRGVAPGDTVYILSLADGHLFLGGRMTVKQIASKEQAVQILRPGELYDADQHAIGEESDGTPLNLHRRLASVLSRQLKFVSPDSNPKHLRFVADTDDLDGQTIRGIRELTAESAEFLDRVIEVTDRLPRSDQLITVTEELLRNGKQREGAGYVGPPDEIPEGATQSEGGAQQSPVGRHEPQHWVVGAMWGGRDDQFEVFIREGYWLLGWDDDDQPIQTSRRDQIRPGDRIAIKKRSAGNKSKIEIRAIGLVTRIDPKSHQVYVRWVVSDLHHEVPSRGCFASIHGPFSGDEDWTRRTFQLEHLERRLSGSDLADLDDEFDSSQGLRARQQTPTAEIRLPEELPEGATYSEGCVQQILINRYERDPYAREACIARFGTVCCVCRLDLASRYGQVVAGFVHVHHLKKLASVGTNYQVDPERDLRPVCPNCHAVIHRREPPYSIEEVQEFIQDVGTD
jgi:predicted HNH restriction endonuclease